MLHAVQLIWCDEMGSVNKEMIVNQEITADLRGETDKFIAIE